MLDVLVNVMTWFSPYKVFLMGVGGTWGNCDTLPYHDIGHDNRLLTLASKSVTASKGGVYICG